MSLSFKILAVLAFAIVSVIAEVHSVTFSNYCGSGTPTLILRDGKIIEGDYFSVGPLIGATAYLNTGACDDQGGGCTAVKMDLANPDSTAGISLASPYAFSVSTGFRFGICGGIGADCATADCTDASREPSDTTGQVTCNEDDAPITIIFCK